MLVERSYRVSCDPETPDTSSLWMLLHQGWAELRFRIWGISSYLTSVSITALTSTSASVPFQKITSTHFCFTRAIITESKQFLYLVNGWLPIRSIVINFLNVSSSRYHFLPWPRSQQRNKCKGASDIHY